MKTYKWIARLFAKWIVEPLLQVFSLSPSDGERVGVRGFMESSNIRKTSIVTMNRLGFSPWRRGLGTRRPFGIWLLELFWDLEFGIWSFARPV
jgi:hypothetical protein